MLHRKYPEGIKSLRAWYSEARNEACRKGKDNRGIINFHVNQDAHIVAVTETTAGHQANPYFENSAPQGELYLTAARIGNYDANRYGYIGSIDADEWVELKKEKDLDSMEELLMQFNMLSGENDVKGAVERFKEYMKPYLNTPEDIHQKRRTEPVEQFRTFTNEGRDGIPLSQDILQILKTYAYR